VGRLLQLSAKRKGGLVHKVNGMDRP
jgi:hypothetical protein